MHNLKPISTLQAFTLAFQDFQESVTCHKEEAKQAAHGYNLKRKNVGILTAGVERWESTQMMAEYKF